MKTLLQKTTGKQQAEALLELSSEIRRSSGDSSIIYAREALEISQQIENQPLIAESHRNLGWLLIGHENPKALKHLLQAKSIFEQTGSLQREALTLRNLGSLYQNQSAYSKALGYYFSAVNLEEQVNDQEDIADLLYWIGNVNEEMNHPGKSIEFYNRALKISEEIDNANDIAKSATHLGLVYTSMDSLKRALKAFNKALNASERLPGAHAKATILMSMSSVYNDKKSYQQALKVNNEALSLAREMSDKMLESLALENIAMVYQKQGDLPAANEYLFQALPLMAEIGFQKSMIKNRNRIARNYFVMGVLEKSINSARQAFEAAGKAKALGEGRESLRILSEAYQQTGDYEKAVTAQKNLLAMKDSSFNREHSRQIAEMQTRYETEQKEKEIALLEEENEKAELVRNAFIGGLILLIFIGFLIYNRQRLKIKKNSAELENTRLKEEQLKQDLAFKNKQLTTHSLNLVQKNETMKELKENINQIKKKTKNGEVSRKLASVQNLVDYSFNLDEDWEEFKLYFVEVHTGFFETLKQQYPDLTPNELRLSALVKLNLTTKEMSTILGITPDSVKTARYRLRKKLGMETEENLTEFMMTVEKEITKTVERRKGDGN